MQRICDRDHIFLRVMLDWLMPAPLVARTHCPHWSQIPLRSCLLHEEKYTHVVFIGPFDQPRSYVIFVFTVATETFKKFDKRGQDKISTNDLGPAFSALKVSIKPDLLKEWADEVDDDGKSTFIDV